MSTQEHGLLELGSNSLKCHQVSKGSKATPDRWRVETRKFPWRVAHEFYSRGCVDDVALGEVICRLGDARSTLGKSNVEKIWAVATGVFREIPEANVLIERVQREVGIRPRVISGEDEARLMAKSFKPERTYARVILFDLGGATTEWATLVNGDLAGWGSLPLGTIRNEHKFRDFRENGGWSYVKRSAAYCDQVLADLSPPPDVEVVVTGGTSKTLSKQLDACVFSRSLLQKTLEQVVRDGPPPTLKPERREVFLAGIVILERLLARCGAGTVEHSRKGVREGLAHRLLRALKHYRREDLHATLLLHTQEWRE